MIIPLQKLAHRLDRSKVIVLAHGCFDVLHIGHVHFLQSAKRMGEVLVVTITPDQFVNKGEGRPVFSQDERARMVAALECVDYVAVNQWETAVETIELLLPDIYVKGAEYEKAATQELMVEIVACKMHGVKLAFANNPQYHSTDLVKYVERD